VGDEDSSSFGLCSEQHHDEDAHQHQEESVG